MISWALRRNAESAKEAPGPDDTQIEQPDTPAPVFAVRALKTALFGTPAPREAGTERPAAKKLPEPADLDPADTRSPTKPAGILLTPGTATSRRKRVSFGEGVKEGVITTTSTSGIPDEFPGKFPSPWHGNDDDAKSRPKTRLTEAMENAKKNRGGGQTAEVEEWEEYEDDFEPDPDVTVDLNEPHSRSGRYWKAYFENYHVDAKTEMEKLVKYKQLAKSYAKQKDAEAVDLNQKLKEEQEKVKDMERKVTELARQVSAKAGRGGAKYDEKLMSDLAKQTALSVQYKEQVDELESLIRRNSEADLDGDMMSRKTSPRTHKTLLETQRELRKARSQVRELDRVKNERNRLKSELKFAEQRATKLAEENKKLASELSQPRVADNSRTSDLEKQLEAAKAEARLKDHELEKLRADYEDIKTNAKTRYREAGLVVKKKDDKIAELQGELEFLKRDLDAYKANHAVHLDSISSRTYRPSVVPPAHEKPEEDTTLLVQKQLDKIRRESLDDGLLTPSPGAGTMRRRDSSREMTRRPPPRGSLSSASRVKEITSGGGMAGLPAVLTDRANLQEPKRASSVSQVPVAKTDALEQLNLLSGRLNSANKESFARAVSDNHRIRRSRTSLHDQPRPLSLPSALENELPKADLVRDTFAPLGAPSAEINTSVMWDMNASKTTLPDSRRAAAIARLERKRAERLKEQLMERNKENQKPSMG